MNENANGYADAPTTATVPGLPRREACLLGVGVAIGIGVVSHGSVRVRTAAAFETAMRRAKRAEGFFVAFDYSEDALREIDRHFREDHVVIRPLTVRDILDEHIARKLI